ncbi:MULTISPECIES: glycosyltransferase [Rufibacter]|uniref:Glycogen(Starch) synthase n=1 Tax=Rufibacter quisquiliarum TaxID=1549639 RepID=A0A839GGU7_9BACT|nr:MULTISPECIES: glycosyltransferase [Rufibacter]MBA9077790.1 glycogen(starch) synthase [Rufibacter quisquiliarum]
MPQSTSASPYLLEIAWEACNQVGGIYTVIRSKVPAMMEYWGDQYCLIGPYFPSQAAAEFEPTDDYSDIYGQAVLELRAQGVEVYYGTWLVTGRPRIVLINPYSAFSDIPAIKYFLWEHHRIPTSNEDLLHQVLAFGSMVKRYVSLLSKKTKKLVAHFHEWMVGSCIPDLRREQVPVKIVFTTHATLLGRYLAMNDPNFYDQLTSVDWQQEARHFNIEPAVSIERAAAHGAHVFTTVSEVTVRECIYLLDRIPDTVLPNGLNIRRFTALHEFQNLHLTYKKKIHRFVMGHFFQSFPFNLDKTLYFFTSGRYEYRNKGFDLTLEALARLNYRLKKAKSDMTVVMFFITKRPFHSINPQVLHSRALMEEIQETCESITEQVGERLFYEAAASNEHKVPDLNSFVEDYWKLRYRRTVQSWKTHQLPPVVTHNLVEDQTDDILHFLRASNLVNNADDRVKIVYHPDFVSPANPLFGMEYGQFVRGCHLGVFPSYYEPWGYTPLECVASGIPAVTSDLSGFGDYVKKHVKKYTEKGIYVIDRHEKGFSESAEQLTNHLMEIVELSRRERINQRNKVESSSEMFDWKKLLVHYERAYQLALSSNI